jgi:hypothetical protein
MGIFKYEDCPLKHYVRLEGWLPYARRRLRALRANRKPNQQRGLRYFTFCAVGAIDVLMLDVAKIIKKNEGRFDNVVFFDRTDDQILETQRRIPGAIGFPGKFTPIVIDDDPVADAQIEAEEPLSEKTGDLDEQAVRERQRKLDIRKRFRLQFPFDVINLDLEEFLFKQQDPFPGQVVKAMKRVFEWQRQALTNAKARKEYLNGFTLMFTTQIGPPAMHPDYLQMLRSFLQENVDKHPALLDSLEERSGLRDLGLLEAKRFDLFFKLAVPKVIASILLDEDWFIDPDNGLTIFQFDRDSKDGPYTLLHMVMDVQRQNPSKDNRRPNTHPQVALDAYSSVVKQIFEVPERIVVRDELDLDHINQSLETIRARRRTYCPDEPQPAET